MEEKPILCIHAYSGAPFIGGGQQKVAQTGAFSFKPPGTGIKQPESQAGRPIFSFFCKCHQAQNTAENSCKCPRPNDSPGWRKNRKNRIGDDY